jgi:hypothetical protein
LFHRGLAYMLLAVVPKPFFLMNYHDSKLLSSGHNGKYLMYACTLCVARSTEQVGDGRRSYLSFQTTLALSRCQCSGAAWCEMGRWTFSLQSMVEDWMWCRCSWLWMDASLSFGAAAGFAANLVFYRRWLMVKVYSSRIFWVGDQTFFLTGLFTTMFLLPPIAAWAVFSDGSDGDWAGPLRFCLGCFHRF